MPKKAKLPKLAKISNRYFLSVTDIVNNVGKGHLSNFDKNFKPLHIIEKMPKKDNCPKLAKL